MRSALGSIWQDIRYSSRRLLRAPGFLAGTALTLALGIGANVAVFGVVYGVLLKPLSFDDPDRLVSISTSAPGLGTARMVLSPAQYFTYREERRVFDDVAVWVRRMAPLIGIGEPEMIPTLWVTDGFLSILRVQPLLGRAFTSADTAPGGVPRTLLTYGCWQRRFGGDTGIIGRRLELDGTRYEVIGVLPRDFSFLETAAEALVPLAFDRAATRIQDFSYRGLARLRPGVTLEEANRDVARMIPLVPRKFALMAGHAPSWYADARFGPDVRRLSDDAAGTAGGVLWPLMGAVGLVLLIACANAASLLFSRTEHRRQELAVRTALGAGRWPLTRAMLSESLLLGLAGGVGGIVLAALALPIIRELAPAAMPRVSEIRLTAVVVSFAALLSAVAGMLFGLVPAWKYTTPQLSALCDGGYTASDSRGRRRLRQALVVFEIALTLVLLVSSTLMIRSFLSLRQIDPGYRRGEEVLTVAVRVTPAVARLPEEVMRRHEAFVRAIERVPGVESVSLASSLPTDGNAGSNPLFVEDAPLHDGQAPPSRRTKSIAPGYFETLGTRLVAGRHLTWRDLYGSAPVVMVSERLARDYWRTPSAAVGRRIRESPKSPWREIVGVVSDERADGLTEAAPPVVYVPALMPDFFGRPQAQRSMVYAIRSPHAGSADLARRVRNAFWSVDRGLPLVNVRTLDQIAARSIAQVSFILVMLALAASVSLLLGVVGTYSVVAGVTVERTREIGIRLALGAKAGDVTRLLTRQGLAMAGLGVAVGTVAAFGLSRLLTAMLFGVSATDPLTYGAVACGLAAVAVVAAYLPARRAARVAPTVALRR